MSTNTPPPTGRHYWRSIEEYSGSPDFTDWLHREFPAGASEMEGDDLSRRSFIRLMGASVALAGFGLTGCRRPESHIYSFNQTPEWQVPGKTINYATAMPRRRGGQPLLVTTYNGRPIKVEGNPKHQASRGRTDVFSQASILDLYDPDRSKRFTKGGPETTPVGTTETEFLTALDQLRQEWAQTKGEGLVVVANETRSPSRQRLREKLKTLYPAMKWAIHEPAITGEDAKALNESFRQGGRIGTINNIDPVALARIFGQRIKLQFQFDAAKVILALDSDFLGTDEGGLSANIGFAEGRRVLKPGDSMNRLYAVENRMTITGAMADHRLRLPASSIGAFTAMLARELVRLGVGGVLPAMAEITAPTQPIQNINVRWITECAKDLIQNAGHCLITIGANQPASAQILVHAINHALGNFGTTLFAKNDPILGGDSIAEIAQSIFQGKVRSLILLDCNPVYTMPADLNWAELTKGIPNIIHWGLYEDETASRCHWHVPAAHYLESWGDTLAEDGTYLTIQPMIEPLFGGWSDLQLLAKMAGQPKPLGPEILKETFAQFRQTTLGGLNRDPELAWQEMIQNGFHPLRSLFSVNGTRGGQDSIPFNSQDAADWLRTFPIPSPSSGEGAMEIVFCTDYSVDDGRLNNNGWMQEWPDPITKLTWENCALLSPSTARKLGVGSRSLKGIVRADLLRIESNERAIEIPVIVAPGHADDSITLHLGYGREKTGRVGQGSGVNVYALRTQSGLAFAGNVKATRTGKVVELAVTQDHFSMEGRDMVRELPIGQFLSNPGIVQEMGIDGHIPKNQSFYKNRPVLDAPHQWAMVIDLTTCTACNACVIACQAENNIPIVGKEQVKKGREMHWIRIDRYYVSAQPYNQDQYDRADGQLPDEVSMTVQPVTCMQCENAPCETVCPVNATVHNEEGLNVMAYNRCIGTRYCANNCPYKVRRFNFFDYNQREIDYADGDNKILGVIEGGKLYRGPFSPKRTEETIKLQKNPNVTVRMRGVMEKCTFCVQRIETAKINQLVKAGPSPDVVVPTDSFKTACQQACPTEAIIFGNKANVNSRVAHLRTLPQNYELLKYLNTQPRLTYLARIRNPNMAMPGAEHVAMLSLREMHHGDHGTHGHQEHNGHDHGGHGIAPPASMHHHGDGHYHSHPHDEEGHSHGGNH